MPAAIDGSLLSSDFLASGLVAAYGDLPALADGAVRAYARERAAADLSLGPASGARAVLEASVRALVHWLGWMLEEPQPAASGTLHSTLVAAGAEPVALVILPWARDPAASERSAASAALERGRRWLFLTNGRRLRLVDATRVPSAALDCDLALCGLHPESLARLHVLSGPRSFQPRGDGTVLEHARALSDVEGVKVCRDLRDGVRSALATFGRAIETRVARHKSPGAAPGADALTAVYRVLFLLFAEARGLVPAWHPIYRDGYTIAALASRLERGCDPKGTWAALQAIARLAHAGCAAGDLRVTAFNSRLFSPSAAPLLDHLALDDRAVGKALEALVFHPGPRGHRRISYGDLGVEQLGSVYERLLEDRPDRDAGGVSARKTSGSFYTPFALTDYLVRVTLGPLLQGRDAAAILSLRVLDPAMGSGAFLVSACRFVAGALERALIVDGTFGEHEIAEPDRAHFRRLVAQRCLFGVDANPMAVQLAELSLWLATLAAEHPISFLEHHLRRGDSLIGVRPADVMRQPPGGRRAGVTPLPLDPLLDSQESLAALLPARAELEQHPDTSAEIVREKERVLTSLQRHPALVRWRTACDIWCALAMTGAAPRGRYAMLIDHAFGRVAALPHGRVVAEFDRVTSEARAASAFHWPLEFPEVFLDAQGRPRADGGFDAILGNPPWEMLRSDPGTGAARTALGRFARSSGLYVAQSRGHTNAYQLFLERALTLLRPGGRLGLLVPSGLLTDSGSGPLRRLLVERHRFESAAVFDNRRAIFPIHRGLRFAAITVVHSERTSAVRCRFGLDKADQSGMLNPVSGAGFTVSLTPALLRTLGGTDLAFPDLPTPADAALVERLVNRHPPLAAPEGWAATFGRELNATDDRDCLSDSGDAANLIVLDGRNLEAFRVRLDRAGRQADRAKVIARLGGRASDIDRPRLAYREVAAATNRTTLIAAVVPAGAVTMHTIFCCRGRLGDVDAAALCALLNSYVANYLVRRWVTTHVTATVMSRLPVPVPEGRIRRVLARFAHSLARAPSASIEAECQARSAQVYGLDGDEFAHVLETFPLVERDRRDAALGAFKRGAP